LISREEIIIAKESCPIKKGFNDAILLAASYGYIFWLRSFNVPAEHLIPGSMKDSSF
jgi:hypothetical protein